MWPNTHRSAGVVINPAVARRGRPRGVESSAKVKRPACIFRRTWDAISNFQQSPYENPAPKPGIIIHGVSLAVLLSAKWVNSLYIGHAPRTDPWVRVGPAILCSVWFQPTFSSVSLLCCALKVGKHVCVIHYSMFWNIETELVYWYFFLIWTRRVWGWWVTEITEQINKIDRCYLEIFYHILPHYFFPVNLKLDSWRWTLCVLLRHKGCVQTRPSSTQFSVFI